MVGKDRRNVSSQNRFINFYRRNNVNNVENKQVNEKYFCNRPKYYERHLPPTKKRVDMSFRCVFNV